MCECVTMFVGIGMSVRVNTSRNKHRQARKLGNYFKATSYMTVRYPAVPEASCIFIIGNRRSSQRPECYLCTLASGYAPHSELKDEIMVEWGSGVWPQALARDSRSAELPTN